MVKRRDDLVILMDILGNLLEGPKGPTRLSQACNLTFDTMIKFIGILAQRGFIRVSTEDGHDLYSISPDGAEVFRQYRKFWETLYPAERQDTG